FLALTIVGAVAQTSRGTVSGLVTDPQNAVIPGAEIELTNLDTNVVRETKTNEAGLYRFDAVDPGQYKTAVKHTGFKTFTTSGFEVSAAQQVRLDLPIELGDVQESVTVTAEGVTLQFEAPVRGGTVLNRDVVTLPYASRDPVSLSLTLP